MSCYKFANYCSELTVDGRWSSWGDYSTCERFLYSLLDTRKHENGLVLIQHHLAEEINVLDQIQKCDFAT